MEKLLTARFRELGEFREDKLPNEAPASLQAAILASVKQAEASTDLDVDALLNEGSAAATAEFLNEVVEPETAESNENKA